MAKLYLGSQVVVPAIYTNDTIVPTATISIDRNGTYNVVDYGRATVNVPNSTSTLVVENNGIYRPESPNIGFNEVTVAIPLPHGSMNIIENGTYNVYYKETVNVNVPVFAKREIIDDKIQLPANDFEEVFSGFNDIGNYCFYSVYYGAKRLKSASFPALSRITGIYATSYMFRESGVTSIDMPLLHTVSGDYAMFNIFNKCISLTEINMPLLYTISGNYALGNAFNGCNKIQTYTFQSLRNLTGAFALMYAFQGCTNLKHLYFPNLKTNSFGGNTNQFHGMLSGVVGCTVHFPAVTKTLLSRWEDVLAGFSGLNTQVLFDL